MVSFLVLETAFAHVFAVISIGYIWVKDDLCNTWDGTGEVESWAVEAAVELLLSDLTTLSATPHWPGALCKITMADCVVQNAHDIS